MIWVLQYDKHLKMHSLFAEDETACSLKGFDIGSRCMVWSGVKWFKAQILGISSEGTKVRGLQHIGSVICGSIFVLMIKVVSETLIATTKKFHYFYLKVLNLSSGHEEMVNPVNVWNRIPEVDSSLSKVLVKRLENYTLLGSVDCHTLAIWFEVYRRQIKSLFIGDR